MRSSALAGALLVLLAACGETPRTLPDGDPDWLSGWSVITRDGEALVLADDTGVYQLNSTLFTDYAHKLRTVTLPVGASAAIGDDGTLDFPVGTLISKTFFYPRATDGNFRKVKDSGQYVAEDGRLDLTAVHLLETRLLVHRADGWVALPYVWNEAQDDARLARVGDIIDASLTGVDGQQDFAYVVPDQNQCAGCHGTNMATKAINPIGPKLANLNRSGVDGSNQLAGWQTRGWLPADLDHAEAPVMPTWADDTQAVAARARAYLDVNCGHCHSEVGPADTSGLFLDIATNDPVRLGTCKLPIAAGQGTGGNKYSIVPGDADASILIYRMTSLDPGAMMPELGRSLVHTEGVALVAEWINGMSGTCGLKTTLVH